MKFWKLEASGPLATKLSKIVATMSPSRIVGYGVNGDPLHEGKLDLPELREQPTAEECEWARDFIRRRRWQEAKTYRETAPHEYTVRDWQRGENANAEFDQFVALLRRCGYADLYYDFRLIYWAVDEFKYWTMGWPVAETTVINRVPLGAPEPWKDLDRVKGQQRSRKHGNTEHCLGRPNASAWFASKVTGIDFVM